MFNINTAAILRTTATAACAVLIGSACVFGAIAPATAHAADRPMTKAEWTQKVTNRLNKQVRPNAAIPSFILDREVAVVGAHFDADGKFTGVSMEQPTRYRSLNGEAMRATRTLAYPMLPASMRGMPRVIAMRVVFSNSVDPAALARTDSIANQVAARHAPMGTEIAVR